ncbi:HlyD family secretion protein [Loktanella atrilutea]|uniref:Membrane fusion protein (MFP) family protein n=1 Tax=Loktanella atrilutea TaxID=366533 RepID=A0A1M5CWB2_LOKAT|nr:HlyD family type I secretion periplasmic adaptor subunit [Loktanella atrilutea]SHF59045.1 HlyD family secretion protein [Loktanella atrilutea]
MTMTYAGAAPMTREIDPLRLWPRMLIGVVLATALIGGLGGWIATAKLGGAVISQGVVVVEANVQSIQHRDGGIVSDIAVREGDVVNKGQLLIRLDDAQTTSELAIVQGQATELEVRAARLTAERDGLDHLTLASDWLAAHPEAAATIAGETKLFDGQRQTRESQRRQLELGISQIAEEIAGMQGQRAAKAADSDLVEAEYQRTRDMTERKLIEVSRLYGVQRERVRLAGEMGEIDASIARAEARTSEINLQILAIDETARTEAQRELSTVMTRLAELKEREFAIRDRLARTDIRAPIDGVVNELNIHTLGGVVTPAEVLVTLVPQDSPLRVDIKLPPTSIEQVSLDQVARLRFPAFNQRVTPELRGHIIHISPATTTDRATGQSYYQATVDIAPAELAKLHDSHLIPGMPVEVFIATEDRTVASYLIKPIMDRFAHAFRER